MDWHRTYQKPFLFLGIGLILLGPAWAAAPNQPSPDSVVVAKVDNDPIYASEASRLLDNVTKGKKVNPEALATLKAQALLEVVDRHLVLAYARRTKSGPTQKELDAAWEKFKTGLTTQGTTLDRYLKQQSLTEAALRRRIAWELTWDALRSKYLTDARAESYFNAHRRELDGTEISVSHILLKPKPDAGPKATAELVKQAQAMREEIASGKMTFSEAARKYSSGPSTENGGDLGFIGRHAPMVESFSRAAFALEVGQTSEPVVTPFGVHLIYCKEIKPGKKTLGDVRKEVDELLERELMDKVAQQQRQYSTIEYSGNWPYFKPGTQEVVGQNK
jgi:parvulin-like peptidyl-prolyl isomerase